VTYDNIILGGGIAGLSVASFLDTKSLVLEKLETFGGLSRSFVMGGVAYDIGPHIIFSKNKEVLDLHTSMVKTNQIRRSNQIFFKGRYVKYPFENDLYALDSEDRDYCLQEFLNNPYENFRWSNMLQFFLATFGEGITRTYLQPYNEKIWKFDPSCMDTQMVDRIPKPPREDVIKSASGTPTEGYAHQLFFHYPAAGGFQSLIDAYRDQLHKTGHDAMTDVQIKGPLVREDGLWIVNTSRGTYKSRRLINTMPVHELFGYVETNPDIERSLDSMLYNSIYIVMLQVKRDNIGDHFAIYLPEKDIIFHRLSKLNFLGDAYKLADGGSTLMAEVTFRPGSYLSSLDRQTIIDRVVADLAKLGFVDRDDVTAVDLKYEKYAYVIYDLNHRTNTDRVLSYLSSKDIYSVGRFAEFEYLNTDGVVEHTLALARKLNAEKVAGP